MKRLVIRLAGLLMILVFLGVGLYALKGYEPAEKEAVPETEENAVVSLFTAEQEDLVLVKVSSQREEYQILVESGKAVLKSVEAVYFNETQVNHAVSAICGMQGEIIQENAENIEQFGLQEPQFSIEAVTSDGVFAFYIGNQMPGGNGRYVMAGDTGTVYLVYGLGDVKSSVLEYADTQVVSSQMPDSMVPGSITLGGTVRAEELEIGTENGTENGTEAESVSASALKLLSHHNYAINYENLTEVLLGLTQIEADQVVAYEPTVEELETYGLQEPYSTLEYSWKDTQKEKQTCVLSASAPQDGSVFLMRAGVPLVYEIAEDKVPWLEWQYLDVVTRFLLLPSIYEISSVEIESDTVYERYELESVDSVLESVTDSSQIQLDTDKFKKLYQCLIGIPAMNYAEEVETDAECILTITFHYKDGRTDSRIELKDGPPLQHYLSVDGVTEFLTDSKYADTILANIEHLKNGETVTALY